MMVKRGMLAGGLVLVLLGGPVLAEEMKERHEEKKASGGKVMKCEVIDVACFVAKGLRGEEHQGCAAKCIGEGGELALLHEGNLYIPVDKDFRSARRLFVTKGGELVSVTGKKVEKSGLRYIIIDGAEKKKIK